MGSVLNRNLTKGVAAYKQDLQAKVIALHENIKNVREDVINPLKTLMNDQNKKGNATFNYLKQLEKEFYDKIEEVDDTRAKFHSAAKRAEETLFQSELAALNADMSVNEKSKYKRECQDYLAEAKGKEKLYIATVKRTNDIISVYVRKTKELLDEFQTMEEIFVEAVKDSFRKIQVFQVARLRNEQYDIDKLAEVFEEISGKQDVIAYIMKHSDNRNPPRELKFMPYTATLNDQKGGVREKVVKVIESTFHQTIPEGEVTK